MGRSHPDLAALVGGVVLCLLGAGFLLDAQHVVELRVATLAPAVLGALGAVLVGTGLSR